jgi:hypothetical protein
MSDTPDLCGTLREFVGLDAGGPGRVQVGMPVEVEWARPGKELTLPRFRAGEEV